MHYMGIAFNDHLLCNFYCARLTDTTHIVAPQINQHQMLGNFFGIGEHFFFQRQILFRCLTATPGTSYGSHGDLTIFQACKNLWR